MEHLVALSQKSLGECIQEEFEAGAFLNSKCYDVPIKEETFVHTLTLIQEEASEKVEEAMGFYTERLGDNDTQRYFKANKRWQAVRKYCLDVCTCSRSYHLYPSELLDDISYDKMVRTIFIEDMHRTINENGSKFIIVTVGTGNLAECVSDWTDMPVNPLETFYRSNSQAMGSDLRRYLWKIVRNVISPFAIEHLKETDDTSFEWNKIEISRYYLCSDDVKEDCLAQLLAEPLLDCSKNIFLYIAYEDMFVEIEKCFLVEREERNLLLTGKCTATRTFHKTTKCM